MPSRHRAPGRPRLGDARLTERVLLVGALGCSAAAVTLGLQHVRSASIAVAAAGLVLAVVALALAPRRSGVVRRGSARRAR